jgi:hypothetical protein
MQAYLNKFVSIRSVFGLAMLVVLLTAAFQWRNSEMTRFAAGRDAAPLDGSFDGYSMDEAQALFDTLGSDGRTFYALSELSLDVLFPLVYGAWLVIGMWLVWGAPWRFIFAGVVVIACAADLVENGLIAYMALTYSDESQPMMYVANLATLTKWSFLALAVAGLVLGLILKYALRWCNR